MDYRAIVIAEMMAIWLIYLQKTGRLKLFHGAVAGQLYIPGSAAVGKTGKTDKTGKTGSAKGNLKKVSGTAGT